MITNPTVLKYDVDAHRLVELYEEGRKSRAISPHVSRRWTRIFRFPTLRLPRPAFASRPRDTAQVFPATAPHQS